MGKRTKNIEQTSEVDMTPMLDIVFIMLIFFIVTTSFVKESAIVIDRPTNIKDKNDKPINSVTIELSELDDVTIGGRDILIDAVQANVEIVLSKNPDTVFLVKVAEKAGSGSVVEIVDQVRLAGVEKVTVSRL